MIREIFLKLAWPNWLFAILLMAAVAISYYFYRRTIPPLSASRRIILTTLRSISLSIALFLVLEPVLQLSYQLTEKPVVAVVADNSASMKLAENGGLRGDSLRLILQRLPGLAGMDSLDLQTFYFDTRTSPARQDSLTFAADGSNLYQAIGAVRDSLSGQNLQAIILLSDGIYNQGPNPYLQTRTGAFPVFTVVLGDTATPRDIAVRRLRTNQVTYQGETFPVEAIISHNGFEGEQVVVTISGEGKVLDRRELRLNQSGFEQKVSFDITPTRVGDLDLQVAVSGKAGEITDNNNRGSTRVKVLKSKLRVAVFNGLPSFDRRFLRLLGNSLEDFDFRYRTEKAAGSYYEGSFEELNLDSLDAFIFESFPTGRSDPDHLAKIMEAVATRKIPIIWLIGNTANYQRLAGSADLLPFEPAARLASRENGFVKLTAGGELHPVTRLDDNETTNKLLWQELPPLETFPTLAPREGSQVLLAFPFDDGSMRPALFTFRVQGIKHLVLNGANISNWYFLLQEDPLRENLLRDFFERAVRWTVNREDINQVQILPLQRIVNVGEAVIFSGQVFDGFYNVLSDARVEIVVSGDSTRVEREMVAEGNGFFRQSFSGLPRGDYDYQIRATRNGEQVGTRSGRITVKPFFLEYQNTRANYPLMAQIARESGGEVYTPGEFLAQFPGRQLNSRISYRSDEWFLWNYWHWLLGLVLLLGSEWLLRKRWGLL